MNRRNFLSKTVKGTVLVPFIGAASIPKSDFWSKCVALTDEEAKLFSTKDEGYLFAKGYWRNGGPFSGMCF